MSVRNEVLELGKLGPLPNDDQEIADGVLERYEELLLSIKPPVTLAEADQLVRIFPPIACFGAEWTLLHLIESAPGWPILQVIEDCSSTEWKNYMLERVDTARQQALPENNG
jgi:hypothetical protein